MDEKYSMPWNARIFILVIKNEVVNIEKICFISFTVLLFLFATQFSRREFYSIEPFYLDFLLKLLGIS